MTRTWAAALCATAVLLVGAGPAAATLPAGNLLANPGAEDGAAAPNGSGSVTVPGWSSPRPTVVRYGTAGGFPTSTDPAVAGNQFFSGGDSPNLEGTQANEATMSQGVSVGGVSEINAGTVQATLTGCLGGYADQEDYALLRIDASGTNGGTPFDSEIAFRRGPTAAQRANRTTLLPIGVTAKVPVGTTDLRAFVTFVRASGAHTYDDGYADNLRLTLTSAGPFTTAPLPCPQPPTSSTGAGGGSGKQGSAAKPTASTGTNPAAGVSRVGRRMILKGRYGLIRLRCTLHEGRCRGRLALTTGKKKPAKLGSAKFSIASGKAKTVKVRLKRSARRRMAALTRRRLKRLKVTATARVGTEATTFVLGVARKG